MEEFLRSVARHYKAKASVEAKREGVPASLPLSRCLFCFPNRRSGLFFARYLEEAYGGACCVPAITTISELFGQFSTRHVIDRTALLFRLYRVYDGLSRRRERESFDQFVFWGDMLLSDFDDVDKYLVDAEAVFANVRDLKEIDARFSGLDPETIEIIRRFWSSYRPEMEHPDGDKREVFGQTWAILGELYQAFRESLAAENMAYEGMMEREVLENLDQVELPYEKVVFVGLTAISQADRRLMSWLQLNGRAEFCWDYADPRLLPGDTRATSAAYFTAANLSDFPNEIPAEVLQQGLVPDAEREVTLYSVASCVGQAQQANKILRQWHGQDQGFDPFRTAVVLPDEKLLLPMLYAVPSDLGTFNVTMGYGLKNTPIAAFVDQLAALQQSYRPETDTFYFRDVLSILSHGFVLDLSGKMARRLYEHITSGNLYQVPTLLFASDPFLHLLFRPQLSAQETIDYLKEVLDRLINNVDAKSEDYDKAGFEFLFHYRKTLLQLEAEVMRDPIEFTPKTLYMLLNRLVAGVSVPFSGEPLRGLQVMGVLETRALDFDNVIILSMNEGVFPAKPVQNTFIPMSLRDAFGLPTQRHRDSVFAYHFYRLIGRARRVAMVYDSRTDGAQTGEESRYVKQLRYLMNYPDLTAQAISDDIRVLTPARFTVPKTPEVMKQMQRFVAPGGSSNLSATALNSYIQCPVQFYLNYVRQLKEDDEVSEGVDSAQFGNILHDAIRRLYEHCEGRMVEASMLQRYIDTPEVEVMPAVQAAFCKEMKIDQVDGYNLLIAQILQSYVLETLRHDLALCPFEYLAGERKQVFVLPVNDELKVRVRCVYDRLDRPAAGGDTVRIVDYKTGSSLNSGKLLFPTVESLFDSKKSKKEAFQLMLYGMMLEHATAEDLHKFHLTAVPGKISPNLYFVRDFSPWRTTSTRLGVGTAANHVQITDFAEYHDVFQQQLRQLLTEMFNADVPFSQCEDTKTCLYCPYTNLCKRI